MKDNKVLVVGGAGYLGSALTERLLASNKVFVFDKLNYGASGISPYLGRDNFTFVYGDANTDALDQEFRRIQPDVVVDLAALVGPVAEKFQEHARISNLEVAKRVVRLANESDIRMVYTSTCSNYGRIDRIATEDAPLNPTSWYAKTKVEAEVFIKSMAKDYVIFRFGTLYGLAPRLRLDIILNEWVKNAVRDNKIEVFEPGAYRPLLDMDEATRIIDMSYRLRRGVYNAHGGNHTKVAIAEAIGSIHPDMEITEVNRGDIRNYSVSCAKLEKTIPIKKNNLIEAALKVDAVVRTLDYDNDRYDNVRGYMKG